MINGRKCKLPNRNIREASSQLGENKFIVAARLGVAEQQDLISNTDKMNVDEIKHAFYHITNLNNIDFLKRKGIITELKGKYYIKSDKTRYSKGDILNNQRLGELEDSLYATLRKYGISDKIIKYIKPTRSRLGIQVVFDKYYVPNTARNNKINPSVDKIINFFEQKIPNLKINTITVQKAKEILGDNYNDNIMSFVKGNEVFLIKARVNGNIAIEECLHPIINTLFQSNPSLFKALLNEAENNHKELVSEIRKTYDKFDSSDINQEIVTRVLTNYFSDEFILEQSSSIRELANSFIQWFKEFFGKIFNNRNYDGKYVIEDLSILSPNITFSDLAKLINTYDTVFSIHTDNTYKFNLSIELEDTPEMNISDFERVFNDPVVRRNRVNLIVNTFNEYISRLIEETADEQGINPSDINRLNFISKYGPDNILSEIKEFYIRPFTSNYRNDTVSEEEYNQAEEDLKRRIKSFEGDISEEELSEIVDYYHNEYDLIYKYFNNLMFEARDRIQRMVGIEVTEEDSDEVSENTPKEYYDVDVTTISGYKSLTAMTRFILSEIPDEDINGDYPVDDLYNPIYVQPETAYKVLVTINEGAKSSTEMLERLEQNENKYPWLRGLKYILEQNDNYLTTVFTNTNKGFMPYDIINDNNEAITVNLYSSSEGFYNQTINNVTNNITIGNVEDTIYNSKGDILHKNVKSILEKLKESDKLNSKDPSNISKKVEAYTKALRSLGFVVSEEDVFNVLEERNNPFSVFSDIKYILSNLSSINNTEELLLAHSTRYKKIANIFKHLDQGKEASIRDASKTRYSYTLPSFLSDFIYGIHNNYKETINKYFNFPYFKRGENKFYNSWLNLLNQEGRDVERKSFYFKNILHNQNGKEYSEWSEVERFEVVLSEFGYFDRKDTNTLKKNFSSYMMRTMSDAGTSLFINAPRYDDIDVKSFIGDYKQSYKDMILNDLVNIVYQEIIKINDIKDRMSRRNKENIPIIKGYDNNPVFTFFPQLNNITFPNGNSFLEEFNAKSNDKTARENWIKEELELILNSEFEKFLTYIDSIGAFSGNIRKLNVISTAASTYKKAITPILDNLKKSNVLTKEYYKELKQTIKSLNDSASVAELENSINNINNYLKNLNDTIVYPVFQNTEISKLEHFFWNDYLANIYIAQIQVGSPQFYESIVNYYKRGKEGYAMNRKVDTDKLSNFKMVTVEDSYYKANDTIVSNLKNSLTKLVSKGKIDNITANRLLESMSEINETDGEAFISLDTYRNIMLATNPDLWTEKHEVVYHKLKNNQPLDKEDFEVIMQIMKPFVFSKVDMYNGSKPAVIPLPYQNKNSIMVLLPNMIKGNKKLEALNKLLNEGNIDMIQFQSAVKVGAQGVINMDTDGDLFTHMISQVRDSEGQEYGGMVTIVDARNFGIQSETPPHYMDSDTNIAVQMRRIMFAYGTQEDITEMDEIITDLVKDNYNKVKELFHPTDKSKRSLYQAIKAQLQNDGRSTTDAIKAVTPNLNNELPIPICNPLNDGTLVPKIIAFLKRIQKQKIDGGALIQATSLGCTNITTDKNLDVNFDENGNIESIDCLVPITFKDILDTHGDINIDTVDSEGNYIIPEDMRKLIAFRIPSEGACSVVPLRIKGFLPATAGGTIITHPLVFTLTGSDLDVDKLFFMKKSYWKNKSGKYVENNHKSNLNRLFDLFWKTIHSEEYQEDMLIASDFSELKDTAKYIESLNSKDSENEDLASPISKLKSAHVNIAGKNLIGPIALQSSNALLLRNYPSNIIPKMYFKIDDNEFTTINSKNSYLSVKKYLAAVVDNAKFPVLSIMGITHNTIKAAMALVRAGFSSRQIALLLNQPVFKRAIINSNKYNQGLGKIITDVLDQMKKDLGYDPKNIITTEEMQKCIENPDSTDIKYINTQYTCLNIISKAFAVGDYLSEYVSVTRFDSANAAPSLSLETVENNISRVDKFYEQEPLILLPKLTMPTHNENEAITNLNDESLVVKFIQAMYGLSYGGGMSLLRSIFPQLGLEWKAVISHIENNSSKLQDLDVKFLNREIMQYLMSDVFKAEEANNYISNDFVNKIANIISTAKSNKESNSETEIDEIINDNTLLQNLILKGNQISIENVGSFSKTMKQSITDSWRSLILSDYKELRDLGLDLFKYASYNYGLYFNPGSYIHLTPFEGQLLLPGYAKKLQDITTLNNIDFSGFFTQFYIKNRTRDKYVPSVENIDEVLVKSNDGVNNHFDIDLTLVEEILGNTGIRLFSENTPNAFKVDKANTTEVYIRVSNDNLTYAKYIINKGSNVLYSYNSSDIVYSNTKDSGNKELEYYEAALSSGALDIDGLTSQYDFTTIDDSSLDFIDEIQKTSLNLEENFDLESIDRFFESDLSDTDFDAIIPNESCPI